MSKNAQLDASQASMKLSEEYLAMQIKTLHEIIDGLPIRGDDKMNLDDLVKQIQHYTYRVALSNASVKLAETLQSVYLGCSDPTGSQQLWQYQHQKRMQEQASA
jgi:hypothetical protein